MAKLTQSDLIHRWCNRAYLDNGTHASSGNLSTSHGGKVLLYDSAVIGVHLTIDNVLVTLYTSYIHTPSRARNNPRWMIGEIRRGMPTPLHHAVQVNSEVLGWRYGWIRPDDDIATLRSLGYQTVTKWGNVGRDDKTLKAMKAKRYNAMYTHQEECIERAATLMHLYELTNGAVPELLTYNRAITASLWTEAQMDEAKAYSIKWQDVDAARVTEHGAFGRRSWAERRRRDEERWAKDREKQAKEKEYWTAERIAELVQQWKGGADVMSYTSNVPQWVLTQASAVTYLRVVGNDIETSRGARVGIRAAKRLLDLCEMRWTMGQDLVYTYDNPGPKVGVYQLQYINMNEVVIGCHTLLRSTIEAFKPTFMEHAARLYKFDARENDVLAEELRPILDAVSD
jgi:hypothetical protein